MESEFIVWSLVHVGGRSYLKKEWLMRYRIATFWHPGVPGAKTEARMRRVISGPEMTRGQLIGIE